MPISLIQFAFYRIKVEIWKKMASSIIWRKTSYLELNVTLLKSTVANKYNNVSFHIYETEPTMEYTNIVSNRAKNLDVCWGYSKIVITLFSEIVIYWFSFIRFSIEKLHAILKGNWICKNEHIASRIETSVCGSTNVWWKVTWN